MSVVDLAVVPTGRGSSLAKDPGSSLDVAGRVDTEQGNRASASANTAHVASGEKPGQEDDADSPAARTVAEKHERDEDLGALPSSATMAGAETSGQNGELGTPADGNAARRRLNDAHFSSASRRHSSADTRASYHVSRHPATAEQPLPACAAGGRDGGAPPGGTDGGADRQALWLSPHHGGAAPQAGRRDAAHQPSRPCLPRAGAAGLQLGMVKHTTRLLGVSKDMGELRPDAAYDSA